MVRLQRADFPAAVDEAVCLSGPLLRRALAQRCLRRRSATATISAERQILNRSLLASSSLPCLHIMPASAGRVEAPEEDAQTGVRSGFVFRATNDGAPTAWGEAPASLGAKRYGD